METPHVLSQRDNWRLVRDDEVGDVSWAEIQTGPDPWLYPNCSYECPHCQNCLGCLAKLGWWENEEEIIWIDSYLRCLKSADGLHGVREREEEIDTVAAIKPEIVKAAEDILLKLIVNDELRYYCSTGEAEQAYIGDFPRLQPTIPSCDVLFYNVPLEEE